MLGSALKMPVGLASHFLLSDPVLGREINLEDILLQDDGLGDLLDNRA